jgi:hypothetical protein
MPAAMRSLALGLLVACTQSSEAPPPPPDSPALQMNDLSVMFPLATSEAEFDLYPSASSPGANGALLPEALYNSDHSNEISYDNLRVIAFRLDPCFAHLGPITDPSTCDNQIRLVFQPLDFDQDTTTAEDGGVHVLYSITREQLLDAANEIATARAAFGDTDLGAVAVHPLLASQGLSGPFAQQLFAIIAKYADGTKIERITAFLADVGVAGGGPTNGVEMGSGSDQPPPSNLGIFWELRGMSVANGVGTPLVIPSLPDGTTDMSLEASVDPLESTFSPETGSADNIVMLANADQALSATQAQRQAGFDAALRIENPTMNSPNTIDCVSCHMAEPARTLVGQQMLGMSPAGDRNAFAPASTIPAPDLAVTTPKLVGTDGGLNIHAFSYRSSEPMINQRVINETAANLAYLLSL